MDQELKSYLDAKFAAVDGKFADLRTEMDAKFAAVHTEMDAKFAGARIETRADIEKAETNLLRAFHGWSRSMEIRVRSVSAIASGADERLALVEERVSQLERRLAS